MGALLRCKCPDDSGSCDYCVMLDQEIGICAQCGSPEIGEKSFGDEGLTACEDCQSIEGGYQWITTREAEARGIL